ncbi:cytochrome ubiquinol oxidase subunit I [Pseudidiomarina andamanensis]|uniref:Cytochrome ubiquinol oxidase subunit I n=1 Tax=Pseudidiomarina andamanensis TaxID=1940690 RepID=A0AA92EV66_9GAMM|nr:cytochrome ubiquinol oxidase subunit I [Pseudidiomarina andamanensis]MDS0219044.1 cytochrome ubiquinol oxidase subunit I [Pseudidiomarina andamanensis]QGT96396.1 cytochrome ubiquinol oxidase subunit I [Pseudidiomarina andamanensis]
MFESWFSQADAVLLARFQFAFTIAFHIIFPAFTIGLASYLAVLEGLFLKTRNPVYQKLYRYWLKIFAVAFGMGVVSGIVMSYQFGTNWSVFSDKAGPVIGPLMGYEVLTAFFLEAGFLGVMLFGMNKVGERLHYFATLMVAVGTAISAFWILSVNSWMQTPAGFTMNEQGQYVVTSWLEAIFNPSFPYRLAHMLLAAYLTTAFVVGAVGAWHLLKDKSSQAARKMFSMAMWMALIVAPLQVFVGDLHGLNTQEHQPAKVAAMEGHFKSEAQAPLYLFGLPNEETAEVDYAIKIPGLASLILKHDIDATVTGLDAFPRDEWPPVPIVFWSFRIMVGIGVLMVLIGLWSGYLRLRNQLYESRTIHRAALLMGPLGFVAVIAGWIVTEVGRQPWVIYGLLRTSDAASPIDAVGVGASLIAFIVVYFLVFGAGTVYIIRKMAGRPEHTDIPEYARVPMAAERLYHEED